MTSKSSGEEEAWLKNKPQGETSRDVPSKKYKQGGGFLGGRTTLEKILLGLLALVVLVLVIVVILLIVNSINKDDSSARSAGGSHSESAFSTPDVVTYQNLEICLTKDCINAASRIDRSIDYSVSPCDDLYQFACGRWEQQNAIPEDLMYYSTFSILREDVEVVLRNLLQEEHKPNDLECMKKAKDLYASCVDTDTINERGDQILKDMLVKDFGGWPLTYSGWDESSFDLVDLLISLNRLISEKPVISFYVGLDSKDTSMRVLSMDQPMFGMPGQKYYLVPRDDKMLQAYEELIMGVAKLQGLANPDTIEREVKEIVDFEILLANISVPDEQRRDSNDLYNPMSLSEVHGNYSEVFDWKRYVMTLTHLPEVGVLDVDEEERIINRSPRYFKSLIDVLKTTRKRVLANYVMWRATQGLLSTQGEKYAELLRKYNKVVYGTSAEMARFRACAAYATVNLGQCVGRMFVKDNFQVGAKNMALDMIKDLQAAFNELLDDLDWMDENTKRVAKEKNDEISPKIGYPEQVMNDTYLEERYANLTYFRDKYFENRLENRRQVFNLNMRELRTPYDKKKWDGKPSTVNAFYSPVKNQIMFPAGILQPPFFSRTYPKSLNYGGVGVVIGHEITHGFDDRGRQYDKHGNLAQWWSEEAIKNFKEKAQCVIDQYGNFTVAGIDMNLNGVNTQGENIADNGGLKQAFKAYRNWVARVGKEEPLLPGLGFSHNQLFFINFSQLWCVLMRDASAINSIRTGMHSPGRFRVIGSAQNSPDFAEAFNCPIGSYMNPAKKCEVW